LDGSAAVGGVDRLGILNQRLIQTRAGTFKCEAFGEFVDKNCGLSPLLPAAPILPCLSWRLAAAPNL
jgi:hypothetical protein